MTNIARSKSILKNISFLSDSYTLKGTLHLPCVDKPPVVIGSHGLFSTGDSPKQIELARKCNDLKIAFFRFDHRGCGSSDGVFNEVTSLEARCKDLTCAIETICARDDIGEKIGLFGSSFGGAACISVASELKIDALVTIAAPVSSRWIMDAVEKAGDNTHSDLLSKGHLKFDISEKLEKINHILLFHGDKDTVVPFGHSKIIYEKAGFPKKRIMQKNGDHNMSIKEHQQRFVKEASAWFQAAFFN